MSNSFCQCSFGGPTGLQPHEESLVLHAKAVGPIGYAQSFAVEGEHPNLLGVSRLLMSRCPPAVPWFVVAVVIDAIKRKPFGAFAHVSKEILELMPSFANGNFTTNVGIRVISFYAFHALHHICPTSVGTGMPLSVGDVSCGDNLALIAAARFTMSSRQIRSSNYAFLATAAAAEPCGLGSFVWRTFEDCPTIELSICKINHLHGHNIMDIGVLCNSVENNNTSPHEDERITTYAYDH